MKKIVLLALVLVAGVALTGCFFNKKAAEPATPTVETSSKESFSGTLGELLTKGKSVKCTSASESEGIKTEGEFYIDGASGRTKSVSKIIESGKTQIMNSIMTKEAVYTWVEGQKEGSVFPITKTEPTATPAEETPAEPTAPATEAPEVKYDFNCEAWDVDENIFVLPGDVNFVDQAAKLKELMKNIPAVK